MPEGDSIDNGHQSNTANSQARVLGQTGDGQTAAPGRLLPLAVVDQGDGTGILQVYDGTTPVTSENGALAIEKFSTYTKWDSHSSNIDGTTQTLIDSTDLTRAQEIRQVLVNFNTQHASNSFTIVLIRNIETSDITFDLYTHEDAAQTDYAGEFSTLLMIGDEVRINWSGPTNNQAYVSLVTENV